MFESGNYRIRTYAVISAIGIMGLTGCSSTHATIVTGAPTDAPAAETPPPTALSVEATCEADNADTWLRTPSNFNADDIAARLQVPLARIAQAGLFGPATCDTEFSFDRIGAADSPVIEVPNEGSPCLVIGSQVRPVAGASTDKILAICANTPQ